SDTIAEYGIILVFFHLPITGAKLECPIKITPDTMVLQYQSRGQSVDCKSTTNETNVKEIFWTTQQGDTLRSSAWFADTHKDWDPRPVCHGEFRGIGNCSKALHYILYKFPESVLIGVVDERSPALVGTVLQLQCDIVSVAPAQDLNVRWMFKRGNETIRPGTFSPYRSPVNVSCIMNITLQKIHNDIQVQCVAELNLGPTLPQPPSLTSSPLRITVLCEQYILLMTLIPQNEWSKSFYWVSHLLFHRFCSIQWRLVIEANLAAGFHAHRYIYSCGK
uniref:Ig-like domain-containing protein n=1 Tax=Nothobranchius furzeri TaxID=105023 RepID=A0A8C6L5A7_NOTFU